MIFPGVLGQAFCTKGTFFDNARIFGLISVQIYDGATKADIKRNELAAAACSKKIIDRANHGFLWDANR